MKSTFPMRTGEVSYKIGLSPPAITGSWEVSMGFWGMNENSWSISGVSGKIYDNSGYMLGSYSANDYTMLEGVITGSGHSIYQDEILLSNTAQQVPNDYNMVSISGNYLEGYLPSVEIGGKEVLDDKLNQTVPFWREDPDNRLLFVTENPTADLGFIEAVSGMGFDLKTGNLSGAFGAQSVEGEFGLIIFGSATTSGAYNDASWNSLNMPMMSLNSHLVCPENLNWYGGKTIASTGGVETGVVFPDYWFSAQYVPAIWAEFPTRGWQQLFYSPEYSTDPNYPHQTYYVPYASTADPVTSSPTQYLLFDVSPSVTTTISVVDDLHSGSAIYAGNIDPIYYSDGLESVGGDKSVTFTDVSGVTGVQTAISTFMGGTDAPSFSLTGTAWGLDQRYNSGRVIPQTASYNVDNLYRRTTLTSGILPTDQFDMYTGGMYVSHGFGGDIFVSNLDSGKLITVWHEGFWTGTQVSGNFVKQELMSFSVTPTGNDWATGYNMWGTLTTTGKQLFINAVAGFFIP